MTVLGRYTIIEQLGAGSMGTVYRALDPLLDREVAVKTIRTSGTVDPEVRERFYREARACARLQHPNIVSVYDLGEVDRIAFISMELLRGCDFRKLIERRQELTVAQKIEAMIQVCEALDHAHKHGVIHRDIKPSNLFYQDDGRVKIVDFGIARLPSSRLTIQGNILGTPNYMAPEQILGQPTDARSDLFSAGLVFFELLVYAHPFQATMIHKRIVESDPDSLFDHESSLPVLLDQIMARALAKKPDDRYSSCGQLGSDLRAVLDGIRDNASPSMSRVELPSRRSEIRPEVQISGDPTLVTPAPAGEDPAEWRLSEVLRLLPEFEEAAERKDQAAAKGKLEELKAIAVTDARFVQAAESCDQTFAKIWGRDIRHAAPPRAQAADVARPTTVAAAPAAKKQTPPGQSRTFGLTADQMRIVAASLAACFLLVVVAWIVSSRAAAIREEASIGTLGIEARRSPIRESASNDGKILGEMKRGDSVALLKMPASRADRWIAVQGRADGKLMKPGFLSATDATPWQDWKIASPESGAQFALMMAPDDSAALEELRAYAAKLQELEPRVAGKPVEKEVAGSLAKVQTMVKAKEAPVETAGTAAAELPVQTQTETQVTGPAETQAPLLTPEQLVARGRAQLEQYYRPGRARSYANQALKLAPNHAGAMNLLSDIREYEATMGSGAR